MSKKIKEKLEQVRVHHSKNASMLQKIKTSVIDERSFIFDEFEKNIERNKNETQAVEEKTKKRKRTTFGKNNEECKKIRKMLEKYEIQNSENKARIDRLELLILTELTSIYKSPAYNNSNRGNGDPTGLFIPSRQGIIDGGLGGYTRKKWDTLFI